MCSGNIDSHDLYENVLKCMVCYNARNQTLYSLQFKKSKFKPHSRISVPLSIVAFYGNIRSPRSVHAFKITIKYIRARIRKILS